MKILLKSLSLLALFFSLTYSAEAQRNFNNNDQRTQRVDRLERMEGRMLMKTSGKNMMMKNLNLTDEQVEQIEKIHLAGQKEMLPLRNQLHEKNARLRTLNTADDYDEQAVKALIEEIGDIRTELLVKRTNQRQEIRSLLDDEQRIKFDTQQFRSFKSKKY